MEFDCTAGGNAGALLDMLMLVIIFRRVCVDAAQYICYSNRKELSPPSPWILNTQRASKRQREKNTHRRPSIVLNGDYVGCSVHIFKILRVHVDNVWTGAKSSRAPHSPPAKNKLRPSAGVCWSSHKTFAHLYKGRSSKDSEPEREQRFWISSAECCCSAVCCFIALVHYSLQILSALCSFDSKSHRRGFKRGFKNCSSFFFFFLIFCFSIM